MSENLETLSQQIAEFRSLSEQRFTSIENRLEQIDLRFAQVDERFETLEKRVDDGFDAVDQHFAEQRAYMDFGYQRFEQTMNGRFDRLERKLDRFIDVQLETNKSTERQLRALKRRPGNHT